MNNIKLRINIIVILVVIKIRVQGFVTFFRVIVWCKTNLEDGKMMEKCWILNVLVHYRKITRSRKAKKFS